MTDRWSFWRIWPGIRDVACFYLGARWGEALISQPGPADLSEVALVAGCLGLPFVFRADELRQARKDEPVSVNGTEPVERATQ